MKELLSASMIGVSGIWPYAPRRPGVPPRGKCVRLERHLHVHRGEFFEFCLCLFCVFCVFLCVSDASFLNFVLCCCAFQTTPLDSSGGFGSLGEGRWGLDGPPGPRLQTTATSFGGFWLWVFRSFLQHMST